MFGLISFFFLGSSFSLGCGFIFYYFLFMMLVVLVGSLLLNLGPEGG
tara:strand:- start:88 stop:228 length:141 start_codon:yes stop_codon:yes gene_type:complete